MKLFNKRPKPIHSDICLIVHNNVLLHTTHKNLVAQPDESLLNFTATELATAARRLLPNTDKRQRLALALPNSEFVATTLQLPAIAEQNLKNAVTLQLPTLLPGVTEPLLLAIQPHPDKQTAALWLTVKRAEELFQAFNKAGLYLYCILPRSILSLPRTTTSCQIYDEDDDSITCFEWTGTAIGRWLHLSKNDSNDPEFQSQWLEALTTLKNDLHQEWKTTTAEWQNLPLPPPVAYKYAFVPPGTTLRLTHATQRKKQRLLKIVAAFIGFCVLAAIGTVINYEHNLQKRLTKINSRTFDVRNLKAAVDEIENSIGPIKNFPQQQATAIFQTLNQVIPKDSWIISVHIEASTVKIEGYSPKPDELIGKLLAQPRFTDVAFSQPVQSQKGQPESKFGINFKLKDINFKDYWLEYFPIEK
jgi:Tfp pilus assembly protein PilN